MCVAIYEIKQVEETDIDHKEGNVLFNDALNTFYLRLYGVTHNGKGPLR